MPTVRNRELGPDKGLWMQVIAGAFALFIAMGVGRFAYTPILPLMQSQAHFSNASAGYLASSNYTGYLLGAFTAGSVPWIRHRRLNAYRWSLIVSIAATGGMAAASGFWLWSLLRMVSGISSGLVFVLVSSIVLDALARKNYSHLSGVLYGGVGLGIAVTGLMAPILGNPFGWRGAWLGLMALTTAIGIPAVLWIKDEQDGRHRQKVAPQRQGDGQRWYFPWLVAAYGCEGLGYIITGTFLVAMAEKMPALHEFAPYCWVVVGLASLPSGVVWVRLARRWGNVPALAAAYLLQAFGVILPVLLPTAAGVYLGSVLFGGTFMGVTTLGTMLGRQLRPQDSSKAIGLMTGIYGIGQIVGAAGAGLLATRSGGFGLSTLVASGVIFAGAAILLMGRIFSPTIDRNPARDTAELQNPQRFQDDPKCD
ncbi:MAG: YbfB/YjiJ family MFS transporter [Bacilli bacterium]